MTVRDDEETIILKFIDKYYNTPIGISVINMYENGNPLYDILDYIQNYF